MIVSNEYARERSSGATTWGRAEICARLNSTYALPSRNTTRYRCSSVRYPNAKANGTEPSASQRTTSHQIMVVLRSHRSTSAPAGRLKSRYGNWRAAASRPARASECVSTSISKGSANAEMLVPNVEIVCPLQITQKLPLRQRAGRARLICGCSKDTSLQSILGILLPNKTFYQKKSCVEGSGGGPRACQRTPAR